MASKSLMACCSWQNTFTTFWPVIISSMNPFTPASDSCCVRKKPRLHLPSFVVVIIITTAMKMLTSVRGTDSTIIDVNVATMVMTLLNTCAIAVEIIWRSESTSLV